jgi:hypothetical protein
MESIFGLLSFFGSTAGSIFIGLAVALIIVLWEWRLALLGLFCVQVGVASAAVSLGQLPAEWAGVMVVVMGLACLILALSAQRMTRTTTLYQAGTWQLRALLLALLYVAWSLADVTVPLPEVAAQLVDLFVWLTICMLVMLGLSDNPLFATIALLMWLIPIQVSTALLVNSPAFVALIGMLSLLLALAGSYLVLVEQVSVEQSSPIVTDITFPSELGIPIAPLPGVPGEEVDEWVVWLQRQPWGAMVMERARQLMQRRRP